TPELSDRPRILVVGGGYVGLYVALKLQNKVKAHGGVVTVVDPLPYMTYQPFLPEVAAGQIEPRHAIVSHRTHLDNAELITGRVTSVDHANQRPSSSRPTASPSSSATATWSWPPAPSPRPSRSRAW